MPETFGIDVCYEKPCNWTPPPIPERTELKEVDTTVSRTVEQIEPDQIQVNNGNRPIPGDYGSHKDNRIHQNVKRAALPEPAPPAVQDQSRQGPPLPPDPRIDETGEIIEVTKHQIDVDPEVEQLALDRQEANLASQKVSRPASLHSYMDTRYILRPEAIESVFYMWRITGDPVWQEKGWHMWESIEKVSWTELAYSAITDVNDANSTQADSMERYSPLETSLII
jgi:hypothetical protein